VISRQLTVISGVLGLAFLAVLFWLLDPGHWSLLTPDQQGQKLFDQERYAEAAEAFIDPMWKGAAYYRNGDFKEADGVFAGFDTPEGLFNRGNALLFQGQYDAAIAAYQSAIDAQPDWEAPRTNLAIAKARKKALEAPEDAVARKELTKDDAADGFVFDDRAKKNPNAATDQMTGGEEPLDDKAARESWLRRVQTKPADFLKSKFAYQHSRSANAEGSGGAP